MDDSFYRKSDQFARAAWFEYRKNRSGVDTLSAVDFVAGWNAAKQDNQREMVQTRIDEHKKEGRFED